MCEGNYTAPGPRPPVLKFLDPPLITPASFLNHTTVKRILLVRLGFFVPFANFSLIWKRHHYCSRVASFDLCSVLIIMAIEQ